MRPSKISLARFVFVLRFDAKFVRVQIVHMPLPGISQVVLRQVFTGKHQRHEYANVVEVVRRKLNSSQRRLRRERHLFLPLAFRVVRNAGDLVKLSRNIFAGERLHQHILLVCVMKPGFFGGCLARTQLLDHFLHADRLRRSGVQRSITRLTIGLSPQRRRQKKNQNDRRPNGEFHNLKHDRSGQYTPER